MMTSTSTFLTFLLSSPPPPSQPQVVAHKPETGEAFQPFGSFASVIGGDARFLWYGYLTSEESMTELCVHLENLGKRHKEAGVNVRVVYVDCCCTYRRLIQEVSVCVYVYVCVSISFLPFCSHTYIYTHIYIHLTYPGIGQGWA